MTIAEIISGLATKLTSALSSINTALVNKGQTAATNMTEIPAKIEAIETGIDTTTNNGASTDDILKDKVAFVNNKKVVGNVPTYTSANLTVNGQTITGPKGYYSSDISKSINSGALSNDMTFSVNSNGIVTATAKVSTSGYLASGINKSDTYDLKTVSGTNLSAENIKSGVSIFGVYGTYEPNMPNIRTYTITLKSVNPIKILAIDHLQYSSGELTAITNLYNAYSVTLNNVVADSILCIATDSSIDTNACMSNGPTLIVTTEYYAVVRADASGSVTLDALYDILD